MHFNNESQKDESFLTSTFHDIKKTLRGEPHTLAEISALLEAEAKSEVDFISLLEKHHLYLKESIVVLMDRDATGKEKQFHLDRFLRLIDMHGKAEEETLYLSLMRNQMKEARLEGFAGLDEHDLAFQLGSELYEMNFDTDWTEETDAKAKVVAALVANHIKEEESHMFPLAKKDIEKSELRLLSREYILKCREYLDLGT